MTYNPWKTGGFPLLNVAASWPRTRALGPGVRSVVWVQGCCFRCPGCIAPEWIPFRLARLVRPEELVEELPVEEIDGLTLSGGEPMMQAGGLARLVELARRRNPGLSVICYTGFTLEQLRSDPPGPGVEDLLQVTDVLIDGLYIEALNDGLGLRGSRNQRVHFLTDRLRGENFEDCPRRVEIYIQAGQALLVGVPSRSALQGFTQAVRQKTQKNK